MVLIQSEQNENFFSISFNKQEIKTRGNLFWVQGELQLWLSILRVRECKRCGACVG